MGAPRLLEPLDQYPIVSIEEQDGGGDSITVQIDECQIERRRIHARTRIDDDRDLRARPIGDANGSHQSRDEIDREVVDNEVPDVFKNIRRLRTSCT